MIEIINKNNYTFFCILRQSLFFIHAFISIINISAGRCLRKQLACTLCIRVGPIEKGLPPLLRIDYTITLNFLILTIFLFPVPKTAKKKFWIFFKRLDAKAIGINTFIIIINSFNRVFNQ